MEVWICTSFTISMEWDKVFKNQKQPPGSVQQKKLFWEVSFLVMLQAVGLQILLTRDSSTFDFLWISRKISKQLFYKKLVNSCVLLHKNKIFPICLHLLKKQSTENVISVQSLKNGSRKIWGKGLSNSCVHWSWPISGSCSHFTPP